MRSADDRHASSVLMVGASRGLGEAMAAEFLRRGWDVVGTVRTDKPTALHALAKAHPERVRVERLDITEPDGIAALRETLSNRRFDLLFVNAGTVNDAPHETAAEVATEEFVRVFVTNALGAMRAVEGLQELVRPDGLIGVMSSGQGSVTNNTKGGNDIYRASKAALNQLMRSYAARQAGTQRAIVLMAPGWIRTALGGPDAPFGMEEAIPQVVDVLVDQMGRPGLRYLDRFGDAVPW